MRATEAAWAAKAEVEAAQVGAAGAMWQVARDKAAKWAANTETQLEAERVGAKAAAEAVAETERCAAAALMEAEGVWPRVKSEGEGES